MSEQSKDNLENFFRNRVQDPDLEFNEQDWLKLEERLDEEMPVAFSFWRWIRRFWFVPLLPLILPTAYFVVNQQFGGEYTFAGSEKTEIVGSTAEELASNTDNSQLNQIAEKDLGDLGKSNEKTKAEFDENRISGETDDFDASSARLEENDKTRSLNNNDSEGSLIKDQIAVSGQQSSIRKNTALDNAKVMQTGMIGVASAASSSSSLAYQDQGNMGLEKNKDIGYVVSEKGAETGLSSDFMLPFLLNEKPTCTIDNPAYPVEAEKLEIDIIEDELRRKRNYFALGVGFSPDLSTVGIGNFTSPGTRWKLLLEYGFLGRFAINTGVVWVNNKYEVDGIEYNPPQQGGQSSKAVSTYGECVMIDIPLNFRYSFVSKGNHQFFVSAGASTYLLLKEDYYFDYGYYGNSRRDHWGSDKLKKYPFGIINISMGYQLDFGSRSAFQIEPFIKIPTTGIGWGNVDLHTIGAYFIYRFRIGK